MKKALSFGVMDFSAVREFVFYKFNVSVQKFINGMRVVWVSVEIFKFS